MRGKQPLKLAGAACDPSTDAPDAAPQRRPAALDRLFLHGIEVYGWHGVFEAERREGQRFVIDVDWWIDTSAAASRDTLDATICYKALYDAVVEVVAGQARQLIEALAARLVDMLFARFSAIEKLHVTLHKPEAPIGGPFSDVGISLVRERPAPAQAGSFAS